MSGSVDNPFEAFLAKIGHNASQEKNEASAKVESASLSTVTKTTILPPFSSEGSVSNTSEPIVIPPAASESPASHSESSSRTSSTSNSMWRALFGYIKAWAVPSLLGVATKAAFNSASREILGNTIGIPLSYLACMAVGGTASYFMLTNKDSTPKDRAVAFTIGAIAGAWGGNCLGDSYPAPSP
ncbi:MAG: hypothetical protein WC521_05190 [Bdellovibrionales bacterium]